MFYKNTCYLLLGFLVSFPFIIQGASQHDLVNVATFIPSIFIDIKYATKDNFTGKQVYPQAACYLRRATAQKLAKVQEELKSLGFSLKVWDGYRPLSVQKIFWNLVPDERYVANPAKGSRHNRGAAVDLTLVTLDGKEIPMPTPFDDFTERAHRDYQNLPAEVLRMRDLLAQIMTKHGFAGIDTEWWHFDDTDWQKNGYEILDISFEELAQRR